MGGCSRGGLGKEVNEFPRLRKLEKFLGKLEEALNDYERDYLTPSELGICVGTLLFYGGILTGFYKMYMFLSAEEDRIIRKSLRRRNNNSGRSGNNNNNGGSGNSNNDNGGSGNSNSNNDNGGSRNNGGSGNNEDDH